MVLKIVYLLASKQSLDLLCLTNACCLFQPSWIEVDINQHSYQELDVCLESPCIHSYIQAVGKPSGLVYLWLRALCSSLGRKWANLRHRPLI